MHFLLCVVRCFASQLRARSPWSTKSALRASNMFYKKSYECDQRVAIIPLPLLEYYWILPSLTFCPNSFSGDQIITCHTIPPRHPQSRRAYSLVSFNHSIIRSSRDLTPIPTILSALSLTNNNHKILRVLPTECVGCQTSFQAQNSLLQLKSETCPMSLALRLMLRTAALYSHWISDLRTSEKADSFALICSRSIGRLLKDCKAH